MASVALHLEPNAEKRLRENATRAGQTLEAYLEDLVSRDASGINGAASSHLSDDQFEQLLDELAAGPTMPHLPEDFSRADIYADHD
jgi:hypothetical protein